MIYPSRTYAVHLHEAKLFITISRDEGKIKHVLISARTGDSNIAASARAIATLIWLYLRAGQNVASVCKHLIGIRGRDTSWENGVQYLSVPDAIGKVIAMDEEAQKQ